MNTLLIAILSFFGFIVAYHTYGKWLSAKIFGLDREALTPSRQINDGVDYVPTHRQVIFGHHFTSIAGTGPIVGPAVAVFWGWLPALLWVVFGSIFIGAVHDFGALVVSLRNRGQTVGEIAGRMISPRAKYLFLFILFMALTIVLAIFGLVIATIFALYPESVLSSWIVIPLALVLGWWVYKRGGRLLVPSLAALAVLYLCVYIGADWLPIDLAKMLGTEAGSPWPVIVWTAILLVYCFIASVLPVTTLLQPRDFLNSQQLILALGLLMVGLLIAGVTGQADMNAAPMIAEEIPLDAPPIWPFLFITIACGACSGFHCLVSSGTSSKQVKNETDARYVGYGAMLLEGALAVIVIIACCAGVGMGVAGDGDAKLTGRAAWQSKYPAMTTTTVTAEGKTITKGGWKNHRLKEMVGAFIEGGANLLGTVGLPFKYGVALIAVLVATFAATTLDTATRLQRYVIQEIATDLKIKPLINKYAATGLAVGLAGALAMIPGPAGPGSGGLILWPMFGATNQLLAGLAFMVVVFYLWRRNKPIWFAAIPMLIMIVMPAWAMMWQMFDSEQGWFKQGSYLLLGIGLAVTALQVWMVVEGVMIWNRSRGQIEPGLPPLEPATVRVGSD